METYNCEAGASTVQPTNIKRQKKVCHQLAPAVRPTTVAAGAIGFSTANEKMNKLRMILKLSDTRVLKVTSDAIVLVDEARDKFTVLNFQKFVKILLNVTEIDNAILKLKNYQPVNERFEIGGNWAVKITGGISCVDIRRWYYEGQDQTPHPTRDGIALRLTEWNMFKKHIPTIQTHRADIAAVVPCYLREDHYNQDGAMNCCECNPCIEPDYSGMKRSFEQVD
jgi:hypothetical protein